MRALRACEACCVATGVALLAVCAPAEETPSIANERTRIEAVGGPGVWMGVAVKAGDREVTRVELCSAGRWTASSATAGGEGGTSTLTLGGISTNGTGGTPAFDSSSSVRFTLRRGDPFPRVDFRLRMERFNRAAWEAAWPEKCPVYFLRCSSADAEIYYFHGLPAPTPKTDPYPFSWRDMRANWADGWSTAPAIGALTVPAVALWTPSTGRLVAYSFQHARSTDRSDKQISVAYCWGTGAHPGQFFALIWPCQRGWQELTYPSAPTMVASHFDLLYDLSTGPTGDVNRFIFDHTWQHYRNLLPPVPAMNDLGWMIERTGFPSGSGSPGVFERVHKSSGSFASIFFKENTELFSGDFRSVDLAYRRGDERALAPFREQVERMLSRAIWKTIDGEECVSWQYPSEGGWEDWIGGDHANTTHNVQQFGFAGALLAMYLHEPSDRLWRYVEGCYHWARHYVYTRGDICDIPCSMFTLQTSQLAMNFLMNLHYALRADPDLQRRQMAAEAFRLAETVVWRNANITTDDPDETDTLDPSFLMPGNQARFWLGQVSWAELCDVFRSMIVMYAETGDERFKYYVRGALDRWWTGFQRDGYHTDENLDVFGETAGKGVRTGTHGPQDSFWEWAQPVGDAICHVTGGRKAAIAFTRGARSVEVAEYRFSEPLDFSGPPSFAFRIVGGDEKPFRMIFSSPFRDLSNRPVLVNRERPADVKVAGAYGEHLLFTVPPDATVEIGDVRGLLAPPSPKPAPAAPGGQKPSVECFGMVCLNLGPHCNVTIDRSWDSPDSWAGLAPGRAFAHGVPYVIVNPDTAQGCMAVRNSKVPVRRPAVGLFLLSTRLKENEAGVALGNGRVFAVDPATGVRVRSGQPLHSWELWLYPLAVPDNSEVDQVIVSREATLFAVTIERSRPEVLAAVAQRVRKAQKDEAAARQVEAARERVVAECRQQVRKQLDGKMIRAGFLPPHGAEAPAVRAALDQLGIPYVGLRPEEIVDPKCFSAADYPILIYTGVEDYLRTVKEPGDGEAALLRYLRERGTLLVLGPCRPFTYATDLTQPSVRGAARPSTLFGKQFGLDLLGPGETRGGSIGFEQPPTGKLTFRLEPGQTVLPASPARPAFPASAPFPATGDRRYRPAVGDTLPASDEFVPILTLYDEADTRYGPGMALVRRKSPGFEGANILWVWGTLLSQDFPYADEILLRTLAAATELCGPASRTPTIAAGPGASPGAAVGLLPLAEPARAKLVERLCRELGTDCVKVPPDVFTEATSFDPGRFPIAVHAVADERYVRTWRLPDDGAEAYTRYVEAGGFLIACGNATQFWYPTDYVVGEWKSYDPIEPRMPQAIGLPLAYGFERPVGRMVLEPAPEQEVFTNLDGQTDVTGISDQRWRSLIRTRGIDIDFSPLAYLTDGEGNRFEGYAAALIRHRNPGRRPGTILYLWGNLIDGPLGEKLMRSALQFALQDVQQTR